MSNQESRPLARANQALAYRPQITAFPTNPRALVKMSEPKFRFGPVPAVAELAAVRPTKPQPREIPLLNAVVD